MSKAAAILILLVVFILAISVTVQADTRSQSNWRILVKADDGSGMNSAGSMTIGTYSSAVDGPDSDTQDMIFNPITPRSAKAVVGIFGDSWWIKDVKSPADPASYSAHEKVWELRVAGLGIANTGTPIRLLFSTLNSSILPPSVSTTGDPFEYRLRMVDNRGVPGTPANGTEWVVPCPAQYNSQPYFSLTLPAINISVEDAAHMISEGYQMQFYQKTGALLSSPDIAISAPSASSTMVGPISYAITYTGATAVTLSASSVTLNRTGTANGAVSVSGSGTTTRTVTISGITGSGSLSITIAAGTASNAAGSAPGIGPSGSFTITGSVPTVAFTFPTGEPEYARNYAELSISGTAGSSSGIASVVWNLNGTTSGVCTGTTEWSATGLTLSPGENTLTVTATDTFGFTGTATLTVTYIDSRPGDAWQGMAMVSLPIIPDQSDPKLAVGFDQNGWCSYDAYAGIYHVYPDQQSWLDPADTVPGRGFWARFAAGGGSTPRGTIPPQDQPKTIHLYPGWNIIGTPFVNSVTWDLLAIQVQPVGGAPTALRYAADVVAYYAWGWDPVQHAYYLVMDPPVLRSSVGKLDPWKAYWIRAYRECDLILPPPPQ